MIFVQLRVGYLDKILFSFVYSLPSFTFMCISNNKERGHYELLQHNFVFPNNKRTKVGVDCRYAQKSHRNCRHLTMCISWLINSKNVHVCMDSQQHTQRHRHTLDPLLCLDHSHGVVHAVETRCTAKPDCSPPGYSLATR